MGSSRKPRYTKWLLSYPDLLLQPYLILDQLNLVGKVVDFVIFYDVYKNCHTSVFVKFEKGIVLNDDNSTFDLIDLVGFQVNGIYESPTPTRETIRRLIKTNDYISSFDIKMYLCKKKS